MGPPSFLAVVSGSSRAHAREDGGRHPAGVPEGSMPRSLISNRISSMLSECDMNWICQRYGDEL